MLRKGSIALSNLAMKILYWDAFREYHIIIHPNKEICGSIACMSTSHIAPSPRAPPGGKRFLVTACERVGSVPWDETNFVTVCVAWSAVLLLYQPPL